MILVDFNNTMISALFANVGFGATMEDITEHVIRSIVFDQIKSLRRKFKNEYGEIVLCCESGRSWRKEVFPYYKASRKKTREESKVDWQFVNETFTKVQDEIAEHFRYKVMRVKYAEADDVIAAIAMHHGAEIGDGEEKILIISSDKDFIQLQTYSNVSQWWSSKGFIVHSDPIGHLNDLIVTGDRIDGIPNVLSEDNCFVVGKRQTVMSPKRKNTLLESMKTGQYPHEFADAARKVVRNTILIDFRKIPKHIHASIIEEYGRDCGAPKTRLFDYFFKNGLRNHLEDISEFVR